MRGPYHSKLRVGVIRFVEEGGSRREAVEQFDVSVSAIRWMQRFRDDGTSAPMPRGGGISPLDRCSEEILALAQEHPDLTLHEMVAVLAEQSIPASRSALLRFFARHDLTHKKESAGGRAGARRRGSGAPTLAARARVA
jgi:transposase